MMTVDGMAHFIVNVARVKKAVYLHELVRACDARGDRQLLGNFHEHEQIILAEHVTGLFCAAFTAACKYDLELAYDIHASGGTVDGYFVRLRK